ALFGDRDGDFRPFTLYPGRYTLKATPYRMVGAEGEAEPFKEVSFRVLGPDPSFSDDPFTVQVFPNPSSGLTSLSLPTDWYGDTDLQLTDMMGSTIWQTTLSEGQRREELNFSHLAEGVYFLQAQNGEHMETSRIVIAH
ncbi:MAG: T9SS type A sorting domain-containing protein, partial [Bacteroidota bacterium]